MEAAPPSREWAVSPVRGAAAAAPPAPLAAERGLLLECIGEMLALNERPDHVWDVAYTAQWASRFSREHLRQVVGLFAITKGADKITKLLQHSSQVFKEWAGWSDAAARVMGASRAVEARRRAHLLERNLSSFRKTLRLLKCLKELQSARRVLRSPKPGATVVDLLIDLAVTCSSGVYYFLDHLLWGIDTRVLRIAAPDRILWKRRKLRASAARLFFRLLQLFNSPHVLREESRRLWRLFGAIVQSPPCAEAGAAALGLPPPSELGPGQGGVGGGCRCDANPVTPCCEHCYRAVGLQRGADADAARRRLAIGRISRLLRVNRAKKYFLMLDMLEWYCNLVILGDGLRWVRPAKILVGMCGCTAATIGVYRLWLTVYYRPSEVMSVTHAMPTHAAATPPAPLPSALPVSPVLAAAQPYPSAGLPRVPEAEGPHAAAAAAAAAEEDEAAADEGDQARRRTHARATGVDMSSSLVMLHRHVDAARALRP